MKSFLKYSIASFALILLMGTSCQKVTDIEKESLNTPPTLNNTKKGKPVKDKPEPPTGTAEITDTRDRKIYKTVKIGEQEWFAENLAFLPSVSPSGEGPVTDPYYYVYGYEGTIPDNAKLTDNYKTYGVLYNWQAAMDNACPSGWHVPSDNEWKELEMFIGMSQSDADDTGFRGSRARIGKKLKSTSGWLRGKGTDNFGFNALPGGALFSDGYYITSVFGFQGKYGDFWSSDEEIKDENDNRVGPLAWNRHLDVRSDGVLRGSYSTSNGYSVRCIKD